jgi:hypothetical protein
MTVWSVYTFEARPVPRAGRMVMLAGQAGAKDTAVRPYLNLPPGGPHRGPSGNSAFSSAC